MKKTHKTSIQKSIFYIGVILLTYFIFALVTFKDYGITFDEHTEYTWGRELYNHYTNRINYENVVDPIVTGEEKHYRHRPIFSQYYRVYPAILVALNFRNTFEFYHLLNMLFVGPLIVASYYLMYKKYQNSLLATLAPIFILLTPRFLGHIPANPKDVPFAVMYFLSLCAIYLSTETTSNFKFEKEFRILALGLFFGITQSMRIIGFTLYAVYIVTKIAKLSESSSFKTSMLKEKLGELFFEMLFIGLVSLLIMVTTWPYMGLNLFKGLPDLFALSNDFSYWDKSYFYLGQFITVETRPWHYLPILLLVTTPLFIIAPFIYSLWEVATDAALFKKDKFTTFKHNKHHITRWNVQNLVKQLREYLTNNTSLENSMIKYIFWASLIINFVLYFVMHPNIYNGIRHYVFLLPIISFLSAYKTAEIIKNLSLKFEIFSAKKMGSSLKKNFALLKKTLKSEGFLTKINKSQKDRALIEYGILIVMVISFVSTIFSLASLHPYEYIYFNKLVGGLNGASERFETEYWGASYTEATRWVDKNFEGKKIYSCANSQAVDYLLTNNTRVYESKESNIIICDSERDRDFQEKEVIYQVVRDNIALNTVYRNYLDSHQDPTKLR